MTKLIPSVPREWGMAIEPVQSKVFDNTEGGSLRTRETQRVTTYNISITFPFLSEADVERLDTWAQHNRIGNVYINDIATSARTETWYQCQIVTPPQIQRINATFSSATLTCIGKLYRKNGQLAPFMNVDSVADAEIEAR